MIGTLEVRLLNEEIARAISKGVGNISTSKKVYNGYKPKRIAEIMKRQGYTITDYSEYDIYFDFGKKFKICLFPDLIDKLNLIKACYFSYNKSIMGIFSLNLSKDLIMIIHADDKRAEEIKDILKEFIIK